jgi:hypothetical protein
MLSLFQSTQESLPTNLPPAGAYLYGYVDTNDEGYRLIARGGSTYLLAAGVYRGDELAAALTTAGIASTFDNGLFSVGSATPATMRYDDRLGYCLGLARRAGTETTPSTAGPVVSTRISPVAIPLAGFSVRNHEIMAEDEQGRDRLQRDIGYVYGAARVLEIKVKLHKWSLDALMEGWCMKGKVSFIGPNATIISGSNPEGSALDVKVLSVSSPMYIGPAQLWAEVTFIVALG